MGYLRPRLAWVVALALLASCRADPSGQKARIKPPGKDTGLKGPASERKIIVSSEGALIASQVQGYPGVEIGDPFTLSLRLELEGPRDRRIVEKGSRVTLRRAGRGEDPGEFAPAREDIGVELGKPADLPFRHGTGHLLTLHGFAVEVDGEGRASVNLRRATLERAGGGTLVLELGRLDCEPGRVQASPDVPVKGARAGCLEAPLDPEDSRGARVSIYYEVLPPRSGSGRALVFINGGPGVPHDDLHRLDGSGAYAGEHIDELQGDRALYYFDQRGTGRSSPAGRDGEISPLVAGLYGTRNIVEDLELLRREVIHEPSIAVMGESFGGMVALRYAATHPEAVESLILHDTAFDGRWSAEYPANLEAQLEALVAEAGPGAIEVLDRVRESVDRGDVAVARNGQRAPLSLDDLRLIFRFYLTSFQGRRQIARALQELSHGETRTLERMAGGLENRRARNVAGRIHLPLNPSRVTLNDLIVCREFYDADAAAAPPGDGGARLFLPAAWFTDMMARKCNGIPRGEAFNLAGELDRIRARTLILVGRHDPVTPVEYSVELAQRLGSRARLVIFEHSAHDPIVSQNACAQKIIGAFLAGTDAPEDSCRTAPESPAGGRSPLTGSVFP